MNKQLTLLADLDETKKSTKSRANRTTTISHSDPHWWRLSEQERQAGIAGIRSIRAILEQIPDPEDKTFAKAS